MFGPQLIETNIAELRRDVPPDEHLVELVRGRLPVRFDHVFQPVQQPLT
jgi:hypothetical protein